MRRSSSEIVFRLPAAGWLARRVRELADLASSRTRSQPGVPPRRLRARTGAPGSAQFAQSGRKAAEELAGLLSEPLARRHEILDFGCGPARVLPHIAALAPDARCSGCDVDAEAVAWARARHPELRFSVSRYEPPLPFADATFDLVYSISVLSHLDEHRQDAWLAELERVLVPGGTALLSVHGAHAFEQFRSGRVRTAWSSSQAFARGPLAADEFTFVPYRRSIWNRAELPGIGGGYGLAFHGERYVRAHWRSWFQVECVAPRALTDWQDVAVLRKPAGSPAADPPQRPSVQSG